MITWYVMQYFYTPTPRSEAPDILKLYEDQGCTLQPDFIPGNALLWDDGFKYVSFEQAWQTPNSIVFFCP